MNKHDPNQSKPSYPTVRQQGPHRGGSIVNTSMRSDRGSTP